MATDGVRTLEARADSASLLTGPLAPVVMAVAIALVYLPSLGGGFLNMDDPWLIQENPVIRRGAGALGTIWTDLSHDTRLVLGGEFLPIRDTSLWLEHKVHGLSPQPMRWVSLGIYIAAVLLFRAALRRVFGGGVAPEVATWLFALHPVHVESVAWLAGRKDVLAMAFVAAALFVYAGESKHKRWGVPLLMLLAVLSKSMAVAGVGLMLAFDLIAKQRPTLRAYAPTIVVLAAAMVIHVQVGNAVGITTEPYGGSRDAAAAAMGRVWLRYVEAIFFPGALSIVQDPPEKTSWDWIAVCGWGLLAVWAAVGLLLMRGRPERGVEGKPVVLASFVWFFVPLLPVSQVIVPLENFLADRYLFLSVMGPALLLGGAMDMMGDRRAIGGTFILAGGLALFAWQRADLFAESSKVFADATEKTERSPKAPYQLGQAYEALGDDDGARRAYTKVLHRARGRDDVARRATNNLSRVYARLGRLKHAEKVLRRGRKLWPRDPKVAGNLAEIVARQPGREAEGRALYDQMLRDFPEYEFGREAYARRYGPPPSR